MMMPNPIRTEFALVLARRHFPNERAVLFDLGRICNGRHQLYLIFVTSPLVCWISRVGRLSLLKSLRTALDPSESSLTFTEPIVFSAP